MHQLKTTPEYAPEPILYLFGGLNMKGEIIAIAGESDIDKIRIQLEELKNNINRCYLGIFVGIILLIARIWLYIEFTETNYETDWKSLETKKVVTHTYEEIAIFFILLGIAISVISYSSMWKYDNERGKLMGSNGLK